MNNFYYSYPLAAYIRGYLIKNSIQDIPSDILLKPLEQFSQSDIEFLINEGKKHELKLYRFKNSGTLPRVQRVLGFLRSISFETLLDVGSGRGAFLFPFLSEFTYIKTTSVDILDYRVEFLSSLTYGGMDNFSALIKDICEYSLPDNSFDVVTLLEVLEHIPNVEAAIKNAVRLSKKFVVLSVPSHEDNNPEHIHLLTKEKLTKMFNNIGIKKLHFDGVNGHLIAIANTSDKER